MIKLSATQLELLSKYNQTDVGLPMDKCLAPLFEEQCALTPQSIAVIHQEEQLTYEALNARSNQIANWLLSNGVKSNQLIGLCAERSVDLVAGVLGILKAGGAYVPFDPTYPSDRIAYMVAESDIKLVLTQKQFAQVFSGVDASVKFLDTEWSDFAASGSTNPNVKTSHDDLAYVLFTSGSTGMPKGVGMVQKALMNLIAWQKTIPHLDKSARTLQFSPISFDVSFQELFTTWTTGGALVLINDEMRLNAIKLLEFIQEYKIERLFLPFIALQHLAEVAVNSTIYPASLTDVITAGEQLQITRAVNSFFTKLPGCRLHNHYGPTETHVVTAYTLNGTPDSWPALPPIGVPIANTKIFILDEKLMPVAIGEQGELYVSGFALARGYINRPELTAERFLSSPFENSGFSRIYKTGDLGRYLSDGSIEYLGRADNQVKVRGYRIELGEVEIAISKNNAVAQVAVTVREDEPGDKRLVAYIVPSENSKLTVADIRKTISGNLPEYMMPSSFVFLNTLPKTPSGKIDRKSLPKPDEKRPEIGTLFVQAATPDEIAISRLWSKLLRIDRVGIDDNFFDLGGNSLLALQAIAILRQENGMDIPVVKLYQQPTVRGLLKALAGTTNQQSVFDKAQERFSKDANSNASSGKTVEDGIAIIGMSGRFPGADTVDQMWQNLLDGKETTSFFKDNEIDPFIDASVKNDPYYVKARGVISNADKFDAGFFAVNPRLAELMDPQQRVFLEVCWEALENSGYTAASYQGLIGVYAGMGNNTYYTNNVIHHKDAIERVGSFQVMVANEKDYIATRISHVMNLTGPGLSIHTACSTSLTAVATACQSLWNKQCDMAIAGGIAITSPVNSGHIYQEGGMFSEDGHTRSFDAGARGTVFSDGSGVVILKRYKEALADGDTIYAVIRGVGVNNDGSEKASFTAPSVEGQANVIAMAQASANVSPESISYIETHGTATPLGDPIEVEALTLAFRGGTDKKQFCAIGSVKSNFGHLTAAAGITGLIKTALALKHKVLPASIHYSSPNPAINFTDSPFFVNDKLTKWKDGETPRRAGVSSFGVGGTNVHIVVEEAPAALPSGPSRSKHLLLLSTKGKENLDVATANLQHALENNQGINIADSAYTLQTGRISFANRKFVVCDSHENAIQELKSRNPLRTSARSLESVSSGVAFMFPGQGSQYVGMGSSLYRDEIVFKEAIDRCAELLTPHLGIDIKTILYPVKGEEANSASKLQETWLTQPALFTIGYALSKLWMSWGIEPKALVGHSIGEFAAACIAGIMSLEDAVMLVANRGKLMQAQPKGSMLSVRMAASEVSNFLKDGCSIAAINGPNLCVISGNDEAISAIKIILESKEIVCKPLFTSHAFHSPMMDPIIGPFKKLVASVKLQMPSIPVVSTATGKWLTDEQAIDPAYWANHLRLPVHFADGIKEIWSKHEAMFLLEMGPRNTATMLARQQATDLKKQFAAPSLPDNCEADAEWVSMLSAIGQLWLAGISISWNEFYALENRKHVPLPTYPFERKRYWVDPLVPATQVNTFHAYQPFADSNNNFNQEVSNIELTNSTPIFMSTTLRKDRIVSELRNVMEEASGIELAGADENSSFMELGMDSLFLTQAALTISKKYGTKITFRQLNESFSSLAALATHIDQQLPAEAAPVAAPAMQPSANMQQPQPVYNAPMPQVTAGNQSNMQWLITQQLQVMQQQLAMMSGMPQQAAPVMQHAKPSPAPVASSSPVSGNGVADKKLNIAEVSENEKAELAKPFGAIARIEKAVSSELSADQQKWMAEFTRRYNAKTAKSKSYTQDHRAHLADPRVVTGFKPTIKELIYQMVVDRSNGCRVWDIDGNEYVDVLNGFGSNFLGYGSPVIMKAVEEQLKNGIELGPQHPLAGEVAKMICDFTSYDRAGFCNTGSEAVLGAMRIARTVTGKSTIVCFNGSYHGINDEVIVRGTKKLKSFPAAAGILPESVENMLVLDYGTDETLEIIRQRADEIAAVMVEPIQSRRADFKPKAFLQEVRKITADHGCLLIFDEVITGFRLLPGGAQEFYDIKADLGTYGKVVGGGMPIGVIAGKKEYMDALDGGFWQFGDGSVPEVGVTYFAGTFVRHPLALAAAKAVLIHLKERGMSIYNKLNGYADKLLSTVNAHCSKTGAPFHLVGFGSLFKVKWDVEQPYGELLFLLMREKGVHIYDGFPCFFTDAFTDADVDFVINAYISSINELQAAGFLPSGNQIVQPASNGKHTETVVNQPPVPGARLGKGPDGNPGWFVADPERPGKFRQVFTS